MLYFICFPFQKFTVANVGFNYAIDRSVSACVRVWVSVDVLFCSSFISIAIVFVWIECSAVDMSTRALQLILQFKYKFLSIRPLLWRHATSKGHYKLLNERHNTAKDLTATTTTTTKYCRRKENGARHKLARTMSAKNAKYISRTYFTC